MKYLQWTIVLQIILSMNDKARNTKWYIDAEFSIHNDTRSHNGDFMTMGRGAAFAKSNKKNINMKSYTEDNLVCVYAVLT